MSSSTHVTYVSGRAARSSQAQTAKARRNKLILAGGAVLLVGLLVVQVPRTMRALSPETATVAPREAATPVPAPAAAPSAPAEPSDASQLRAIESLYTAKDPFGPRQISAPGTAVPVRTAPPGERDPFGGTAVRDGRPLPPVAVSAAGVRDPFAPREVRAATAPPPVKEPIPVDVRPRGYTIILASVPVRRGERSAIDVAAAARARGVPAVGVLRSSEYPTLRPGYFAVYSRLFETRAEAQRAIGQARALGYPTAYVRPLGR